MQEDYLIEVASSLTDENDKKEFRITTNAQYTGRDDDYTIIYSDMDDDMNTFTTSLRVQSGSMITIERKGEALSHIILEKEKRHISQHKTPYGMFTMGISTEDICSDIHNGNGTLYFRYTTDIDMMPVNIMEFNITLSKRN
ncbi:MAG: DUF1934 domain-containing protein [Clostridia bacterium]|nr:DUF1934 domain-containing protein [Clostridia bacterium]